MTATDNEAMSALHALLDERQRYQGWLSTLEGRRNSTPPHVYERVQQDYTSRLDRVMRNLAERAGQLSGTIESMTADLSALREQESERTDERHEAELRAAVGEFTPEDWERRRAEADSDLEQIAAERHSLQAELEELQRIVALTGTAAGTAAGGEAAGAGHSNGADAGSAASAGSARSATHDRTQSIEEFVAEWHPPHVGQSQGRASDGGHGHVPEAADLADLVIPAAPMGGNPVGAAGADYGIANGVTGVSGAGGAAPLAHAPSRVQQQSPASQGDARRDADKTLKCPECGAMNYATEWYCEKCGGELSTF